MSVLQDVAGAMFGGVASAIVGALESLCRERERAISGGFIDEVLELTSMKNSDVNPVIIKLLKHNIVRRRGHRTLELCPPMSQHQAHVLSGGLLF